MESAPLPTPSPAAERATAEQAAPIRIRHDPARVARHHVDPLRDAPIGGHDHG